MKFYALLLVAGMSLRAGAQATPVRLTTRYVTVGRAEIDTAAVTTAFRSGLVTDSIIRVLPSIEGAALRRGAPPLEPATGLISLDLIATTSRGRLRASWILVADPHRQLLDSMSTVPLESLLVRARALGRRVAERVQASVSQPRPPNER